MEKRETLRMNEMAALTNLVRMLRRQTKVGKRWVVEQPYGSTMLTNMDSPIAQFLATNEHETAVLDQCEYEAQDFHQQPFRKRTVLLV